MDTILLGLIKRLKNKTNQLLANTGEHSGEDITIKLASEISNYPNVWDFLKARVSEGNYEGIYVGDYVPVTIKGKVYHITVAGIDTYRGLCDGFIGHHIDFISRELWSVTNQYNKSKYNNALVLIEEVTLANSALSYKLKGPFPDVTSLSYNGSGVRSFSYDPDTSTLTLSRYPGDGILTVTYTGQPYYWQLSNLFMWINSSSGRVVTGFNTSTSVDYTNTGIWKYLPDEIKNVVTEKFGYLGKRSLKTGESTETHGNALGDNGKLWIPAECEVFDHPHFAVSGYESGCCEQYPIFKNKANRSKGDSALKRTWWLINACSNSTTNIAAVDAEGNATCVEANSYSYVPICFRIAQ